MLSLRVSHGVKRLRRRLLHQLGFALTPVCVQHVSSTQHRATQVTAEYDALVLLLMTLERRRMAEHLSTHRTSVHGYLLTSSNALRMR